MKNCRCSTQPRRHTERPLRASLVLSTVRLKPDTTYGPDGAEATALSGCPFLVPRVPVDVKMRVLNR